MYKPKKTVYPERENEVNEPKAPTPPIVPVKDQLEVPISPEKVGVHDRFMVSEVVTQTEPVIVDESTGKALTSLDVLAILLNKVNRLDHTINGGK